MDLLVLLSVLAITQTIVLARPSDTNLKTKRSVTEDSGKVFKPSSIRFPTELENGFTVILNGTLDPESETFEVVFPSRNRQENDHCRIKYNFKNSTLDMFPEHPDWKAEEYVLVPEHKKDEVLHPTFSIRLKPLTLNDKHVFKFSFEGNNGGDASPMTCKLERFDDFERIEFRSGLHSITSFFLEF